MSFKKFVGIIQIVLSIILVAIPAAGLILVRKAGTNFIQESLTSLPKELGNTVSTVFMGAQSILVFAIIISLIIGLALFLQGIVNIKDNY